MKPTDLFDAMSGISEKYIHETEQALEQQRASREQQSAAETQSMQSKENITVSADTQKRHGSKAETGMSTGIQRIATGIAAAAACAVFVGGGWFIVQQAKQNQTEIAGSLTETGDRNFLGGTGEIHVAVSNDSPIHRLDLMYDDTNVYFYGGKFTADRNSGAVSEAYQTDESVLDILSHTLWDGEQFYYQDGDCLYKMDMAGSRDTSTPFYEVNPGFAEQRKALSPQENFSENAELSDAVICGIQKLREDEYVISLYADITENGECIGFCNGAEVYRPQDNSEPRVWEQAPGIPEEIVLVRDNLAVFRSQSFGRFSCWDPDTPAGIPLGVNDPAMAEMYSSTLRTLGDGETTKPAEYDTAWAVHDNSIYYMTEIISDNVNYEPSHYAALDINTGAFTDFGQAEFDTFIPADDGILYVTRDGKALYSSDYTLSALTKQELFSYDTDSVPAEIQDIISTKWDAKPLKSLDAADANYAALSLDCADGSCSAFALYDRQTGQMHYYKEKGSSAGDLQDDDENTEPAEQNHNINALGGTGTLYPVGWTNHSDTSLLRDNDNYYYFDTSTWYACPLAGGQFTRLTYPDNSTEQYGSYYSAQYPFPYLGFLSDGERIYTTDLDIVSDGSTDNHFDPSAAQEILRRLNADSVLYHFKKIWHIRNRYFIVIQTDPAPFTSVPDKQFYEVWTDDSGSILSERMAEATLYYCSDDKREMYAVMNGELHLLDCPGYEQDDKPDPTAYGRIYNAYCVGDEEYYITVDNALYTRENGQPVLIDENQQYGGWMQLAPDQRFFYLESNENSDTLYEWKDGEKELIYQPGTDESLNLCGFEANESGGYHIIVFQWDRQATASGFQFIDAATNEIVKQLNV